MTPLGGLVAHPARGLVYGNRGCLHDEDGRIRRSFQGARWIACQIEFRGRRRQPLMQPGRYTELFFLDEATAFAAGHRPCAECRRNDYRRFRELWPHGVAGADAIDAQLHAERLDSHTRTRRCHEEPFHSLPDGAFVLHDGEPWLVLGAELLRWTPAGYGERALRPVAGTAVTITPPSLVEVLRRGWQPLLVPFLHPTSRRGPLHGDARVG